MLKKEIIWREILWQAMERKITQFTQKELAAKFDFSVSTVFNALKVPRQSGAIEVRGRFFSLIDIEKLLTIWGTHRHLAKDIIYKTHVALPVQKIEGELPPDIIYTTCSAFRLAFKETPADYDKVYVYTNELTEIKKRFLLKKGYENLIVLKADKFLTHYGQSAPWAQVYVDLWNLKEWYAHDFLKALNKKIF
ncbi:MAG: hypothetical protein V1712_01175 [Patescibacteria group bacterium]